MSSSPTISGQEPQTSTRPHSNRQKRKFTRGEKCLFAHLVVTFSIILLLAIIYFIHLIMVHHSKESALMFSRRKGGDEKSVEPRHLPLGYLYLNTSPVTGTCNTLLLHSRWSLAPGHCAAMRTDPDMADLLNAWRIAYRTPDMEYIESEIKKSIPHPHFDRDDFSNNVGVFEHVDEIHIAQYVYPEPFALNDIAGTQNSVKFELVGWEQGMDDGEGGPHELKDYTVSTVATDKCNRFVSPIEDLRSYEFCVIMKNDDEVYLEHGAVLLMDSKIIGFFSWGERRGKGVPFIVVNIQHFKEWLDDMLSIAFF